MQEIALSYSINTVLCNLFAGNSKMGYTFKFIDKTLQSIFYHPKAAASIDGLMF